jgi:hypothetical protein
LGGNFLQEAAIRFASNGWAPLHKKNYSIKGVDSHFLHYRNTVRRVEYQGGAKEKGGKFLQEAANFGFASQGWALLHKKL